MKLMGVGIDKKIEGGIKLEFCIDDEMSWIVCRPSFDNERTDNEDKLFIYNGTQVGVIITKDLGTFGGKVSSIDYDNKTFKIGDETLYEDTTVDAIGIIGSDSRPRTNK